MADEPTADTTTPPPAEEPLKQTRIHTGTPFLEAAGMLLVWSILVINEGATRFNDLANDPYPSLGDYRHGRIREGVFFFGGLFEVIFGFMGLFVGGGALVFRFYNDMITKVCMTLQSIMGWYVFVVFVFVDPAARAANLEEGLLGLSRPLTRFLITLGIFTAFHMCLALQGGQFVFFARLIAAATDTNFLMQKTGNTMRSMFWNGNIALAGFWTFLAGCILAAHVEDGLLDVRANFYEFPPQVGREPGFTIFVGLIVALFGLYGMAAAVLTALPKGMAYYITGMVVYVFAFLNFGIVQFGLLPETNNTGVSQLNGLVFMTMALGPYFLWQASQESSPKVVEPMDTPAATDQV